jgi:hypothetical protein
MSTYVCIYIRLYTYVYVCTYICTPYVYIHIYTCMTCIYIYIYIYTHTPATERFPNAIRAHKTQAVIHPVHHLKNEKKEIDRYIDTWIDVKT